MPSVTGIVAKRRGCRLRTVELDDDAWRTSSADAVAAARIVVGRTATIEEFAAALDAAEPRAARERALRLLGFRDRTESEMRDRLTQDGYPHSVAAEVCTTLVDQGLIDDERYARAAARTLTDIRGLGRARALRELISRGVDASVAEDALADAMPEDVELDAAMRLAQALAAGHGASVDRIASRLARKGYAPRIALDAARAAIVRPSGPDDETPTDDDPSDLQ